MVWRNFHDVIISHEKKNIPQRKTRIIQQSFGVLKYSICFPEVHTIKCLLLAIHGRTFRLPL
jgi:hypothetical protein